MVLLRTISNSFGFALSNMTVIWSTVSNLTILEVDDVLTPSRYLFSCFCYKEIIPFNR